MFDYIIQQLYRQNKNSQFCHILSLRNNLKFIIVVKNVIFIAYSQKYCLLCALKALKYDEYIDNTE